MKKICEKQASKQTLTTLSSLATTLFFVVFNVVLYVTKHALWNVCICVYYALLFAIRLTVFVCEKKWKNDESAQEKKVNASVATDVLFLIADISLIAPIALMAMRKREVSYSSVVAISSAAYTVFKIATASVNLKKTVKTSNLFARILRALNFKDAIMSIIVLQYVLISTFSEGDALDVMCDVTNFILWGVIVAVSVIETGLTIKQKKEYKNGKRSE